MEFFKPSRWTLFFLAYFSLTYFFGILTRHGDLPVVFYPGSLVYLLFQDFFQFIPGTLGVPVFVVLAISYIYLVSCVLGFLLDKMISKMRAGMQV